MKTLNKYIYENIFHKSEIYENIFRKSEIYENNFHKSEINEKLIINKDFKNANNESLQKIMKLEWFRDNEKYYGCKNPDSYELFCNYIESAGDPLESREEVILKQSSSDDKYFGAFDKSIKESLVFYHNTETYLYEKISLFVDKKHYYCYMYRMNLLKSNSMQPLNNNATFNKGTPKYFSIPKDIYDNITEMYESIVKQCK